MSVGRYTHVDGSVFRCSRECTCTGSVPSNDRRSYSVVHTRLASFTQQPQQLYKAELPREHFPRNIACRACGAWRTTRHAGRRAALYAAADRLPADQSGERVARWTGKSPDTPDILARKLLSRNLSFTARRTATRISSVLPSVTTHR